VFSARMKSTSARKTRLWIKARAIVGGFYTRSSIRADGFSSAQHRNRATRRGAIQAAMYGEAYPLIA